MEERRRFSRVQYRGPISFSYKIFDEYDQRGWSKDFSGGCLSVDLSEGGLRFHSFEFIALGTVISFSVPFSEEKIIQVSGKVVWVQQRAYTEEFNVGLEFNERELTPHLRQEIGKRISHLQAMIVE